MVSPSLAPLQNSHANSWQDVGLCAIRPLGDQDDQRSHRNGAPMSSTSRIQNGPSLQPSVPEASCQYHALELDGVDRLGAIFLWVKCLGSSRQIREITWRMMSGRRCRCQSVRCCRWKVGRILVGHRHGAGRCFHMSQIGLLDVHVFCQFFAAGKVRAKQITFGHDN